MKKLRVNLSIVGIIGIGMGTLVEPANAEGQSSRTPGSIGASRSQTNNLQAELNALSIPERAKNPAGRLWARIARPQAEPSERANPPTYLQDIMPIVMGKCYRCHNQQSTFLNNWLDYRSAYSDRRELRRRIWDSWRGDYFKQSMPAANSPESATITEHERLLIKEWVDTGAAYGVPPKASNPKSKAERMEVGQRLFSTICAACHQPTGLGIPNQFPPLAGSDFLNADKERAVRILLNGFQGEVVVNGNKFNNSMPLLPLSDADIASALTYVFNSFGNSGQEVTPEEVSALRGQGGPVNVGSTSQPGSRRPAALSPWE
jgi:mono/diheme cytochrome c family protein